MIMDKFMEDLKRKYLSERKKRVDYTVLVVLLFYFIFFIFILNIPSIAIFYYKFLAIVFIIFFILADDHIDFLYFESYVFYFFLQLITSLGVFFLVGNRRFIICFEIIITVLINSILYQKIKKHSYEKKLLADNSSKKWLKDLQKLEKKWSNVKEVIKIEEKNKQFKKILKYSLIPTKKKVKLDKTKRVINGIYSYETSKILSLLYIKKNLAKLFSSDIENLNNLYNKNYKGKITLYYDNENMVKMTLVKMSWLINEIEIYYNTGEKMCSCIKIKNYYIIDFFLYDKSGNVIQNKKVNYYDFEFVGENIGNNLYIPYNIITLCSLLNTDDLIKFI